MTQRQPALAATMAATVTNVASTTNDGGNDGSDHDERSTADAPTWQRKLLLLPTMFR